jgi:hypothetical protein
MRDGTVMLLALLALTCRASCPPCPALEGTKRAEGTIVATARADLLRLTVERVSPPAPTEKVALRFAFRNLSRQQSLWLKTSFRIHLPTLPFTDMWLDISDEEGGDILPNCRIRGGPPGSEGRGYVHLAPGAETAAVRVLECHDFPPGKFGIVAHYRDRNANPPPPPEGAAWFVGDLVSEPIEIEVTKQ